VVLSVPGVGGGFDSNIVYCVAIIDRAVSLTTCCSCTRHRLGHVDAYVCGCTCAMCVVVAMCGVWVYFRRVTLGHGT
jgi:hypothetical protein